MASQEVPLAEVGKGQQQDSEAAPPGYYAASSPGPQQQQQQQQQPAISPNPAVPNPAHINNAPAAGQKAVYAGAPGAQPMGGAAFPVATPLNMLGSHPQPVDCPFCGVRTLTAVNQEASTMTQYVAHFSFVRVLAERVWLFAEASYVLTLTLPVSRPCYAASSASAWSSYPTRPICPSTLSTAAVLAGSCWPLRATAGASML